MNAPNEPGNQDLNLMTTPQGEELFRMESPWALVFNAVPDATMILDRHHRIIRINKAAAVLLGVKQEDAVGRKCHEAAHGLNEPPAFCPHTRLLADGKEHEVEITDEKLGATFHISASPILDPEGHPIGGVHVARDITKRKLAEDAVRSAAAEFELKVAERTAELFARNQQLQAEIAERKLAETSLKKSEQRFRDLAELLPQFIFETDSNGFFTFANRAGMEALGVSEKDIARGLFCLDVFIPEDVPKVADRIGRVLGGEPLGGNEYWVRGRDGAAFPVVTYSLPIIDEGNVVGIRGVAIDLSEQKKREQELRESHRKLVTLLGNLPGMVYRCRNDDKRTMEFVSEGCKKLTGYHSEDLLGNSTLAFRDLVHPEDAPNVWKSIQDAVAERSPFELTYRIYTGWGGEKWVSERGVGVFPEHGELEALEGCIFDITEHRLAEEALLKTAANLARAQRIARLGSWEWNITRNELHGSDEIYRILGLTRVRFGVTIESFLSNVHPEDRQFVDRSLNAALYEGKPFRLEHRVAVPWGPVRFVKQIGEVTFDDRGRPVQMTGTVQDVTAARLAEDEVRRGRENFTNVVEHSLEGILVLDLSGSVLYANPAACVLFGRSREDLESVHFGCPAALGRVEEIAIFAAESHPGVAEMQATSTTWKGTGAYLVMLRDITEQKRAEDALRKSEALLRNVLETLPVGVWLTDKHGRIVMGNPAGRQAWAGASQVGIKQYGGYKGWWPDTGTRIAPHEWAGARALTKGETCIEELVEVECFDGTRKMILQSAVPIWDPPGEISGAIIVNLDVTARVKAERELKNSEEKMRQIIECSPIGVAIVRDGKYEFVNSAFVRMFGYDTANEIVGLAVEALYVPEELDRIKTQEAMGSASVDTPSFFERRGMKRSGAPFDVSAWVRTMDILGEPAVLGFVIDVSEAKALRAQLLESQKKEAIGTLAGGIAHDFNNLLTVIVGYTELLLMNKAQDDPAQEDLQKVGSAAARGAELVHQLLTFLRTGEAEPRPLNVNHQVEQVVKLISRTIPKMITIETNLARQPKMVNADSGQIEQVLLNLVLNAKDAMPDGGTLRFETRSVMFDEETSQMHLEAKCGEYVELTVSDTGTGMDEETQQRIFEPFFTTKEPGRGTGLGLATVSAIVKQHSGFVTCTSQQGEGTSFRIYLPVHRLAEPYEEKRVPPSPVGGTETILLVDDEEPIRELGRKILQHGGYTVVVAKDGEEALELYRKEHPSISLVLLDLIMPKMGGRQCLKELTAVNPAAKVLITSGYSSGGKGVDAAALGALGFVKKPHLASELLQRVREALDAP